MTKLPYTPVEMHGIEPCRQRLQGAAATSATHPRGPGQDQRCGWPEPGLIYAGQDGAWPAVLTLWRYQYSGTFTEMVALRRDRRSRTRITPGLEPGRLSAG